MKILILLLSAAFVLQSYIVLAILPLSSRKLIKNIRNGNVPIFNFASEMQQLIGSAAVSTFELESLFYEYISTLRDFYVKEFSVRSKGIHNLEGLSLQKNIVLRECEAAMKAAVPAAQTREWSFSGPFKETEDDIERAIEEILSSDDNSFVEDSKPRLNKMIRSFKWIALQLTLFGLNFAQNEWHRWVATRAADRRLAEVPEFPLL